MIAPIAPANTTEWHQLRRTGIGASEAAAACGLSRYKTPLHVWANKVHGEEQAETAAMRLGLMMEPVIATEFVRQTGYQIQPAPGLFRHPKRNWQLASPDAFIFAGRSSFPTMLAEFKNTTSRNADLGDPGTDEVPFEWLCQAQQQMAVCDLDKVIFGVLVDGFDFRVYEVERNDKIIDSITAREAALWDLIQKCEPPALDPNHGLALDAAQAAFRRVNGGLSIELSGDGWKRWERMAEIKTFQGEFKKEGDALKAALLLEMGEAEFARLPGGDMLKRTEVKRATYTVESTSYVTLTYKKAK